VIREFFANFVLGVHVLTSFPLIIITPTYFASCESDDERTIKN